MQELEMALRLRTAAFTLRTLMKTLRGFIALSLCIGGCVAVPALATATTSCPSWDVQSYCCPSACTASKERSSSFGDAMLQACMRGLRCSDDEASHATVFQMCRCVP